MALAGNARDNPAPNSVCASPDARESYSNTKTCRGDSDPYPTDSDANVACTDSCSANGDPDAAYAHPYPANTNSGACSGPSRAGH